MVKPSLNPNAESRVKGMVELRDCVQKLIDQQLYGGTDEEIRYALQTKVKSALRRFHFKAWTHKRQG